MQQSARFTYTYIGEAPINFDGRRRHHRHRPIRIAAKRITNAFIFAATQQIIQNRRIRLCSSFVRLLQFAGHKEGNTETDWIHLN